MGRARRFVDLQRVAEGESVAIKKRTPFVSDGHHNRATLQLGILIRTVETRLELSLRISSDQDQDQIRHVTYM